MTKAKAIAAFVGGIITWLLATGSVPFTLSNTVQFWLGLIAAICTAIVTYAVPNRPVAGATVVERR